MSTGEIMSKMCLTCGLDADLVRNGSCGRLYDDEPCIADIGDPDNSAIAAQRYPLEEIGMTPRGTGIFRKENGVGGHTYWSDSIGGGVMVWDTCLASIDDLEFCIRYEKEHGR